MVDSVTKTLRFLYGSAAAFAVLALGLLAVFGLVGEFNSATLPARVMGIGLALLLIGAASGIQWVAMAFRARKPWAWVAAVAVFSLLVPTILLLPLGVLGLKSLFAPETRAWALSHAPESLESGETTEDLPEDRPEPAYELGLTPGLTKTGPVPPPFRHQLPRSS